MYYSISRFIFISCTSLYSSEMPNRVRHTFYVYRGWERDARKVMTVGVCGCNDTNENDAAENRLFWISFIPHILLLVLRLDACWWWWWYDGCVDGISPGHKTANSSTVKWTLSNSFHFPCRALLGSAAAAWTLVLLGSSWPMRSTPTSSHQRRYI